MLSERYVFHTDALCFSKDAFGLITFPLQSLSPFLRHLLWYLSIFSKAFAFFCTNQCILVTCLERSLDDPCRFGAVFVGYYTFEVTSALHRAQSAEVSIRYMCRRSYSMQDAGEGLSNEFPIAPTGCEGSENQGYVQDMQPTMYR